MASHPVTVHYEPSFGKCLLNRESDYFFGMETPNDRLRLAREAMFETAADAARAMGVSVDTYRQHENDTRGLGGIPRKAAERYAKKFKVSLEWLLTGKGEQDVADPLPSKEMLEQMVREAIETEVTVETRLADLPGILGSNLHEQLERFVADPGVVDFWGAKIARDKGAQSPSATTKGAPAKSRNA